MNCCCKCKKILNENCKVYYTLNDKLLPVTCCSNECAVEFQKETIKNLEKIIELIKNEPIVAK